MGWALVSFAVNLGFSRFSFGAVLPALHAEFGASYGTLGVVNAINLAGYLVGTLFTPLVAGDARLCRRGFVVSTLLVGAGLAASAGAHDIVMLGIWRGAIGIASAFAIGTTAVLTFERVAPEFRGRASSAMWAGLGLGLAAAGPIAPLANAAPPVISWRLMWIVMALFCPVAVIGFTRALRRTPPHAILGGLGSSFELRDLVRPQRFLFLNIAYFAAGAAYIAYATFAVALFRMHGVPDGAAGFAWAVVGLSGTVSALLIGRHIDSPRIRTALAFALACCALGAAFALTTTVVAALASAVTFGIGSTATPAIVTALTRKRSSAKTYPANFSAVTTMLAVGQFVGPVGVAPLVDRYGLSAAAAFAAIVFGAGVVFAMLDARFAQRSAA